MTSTNRPDNQADVMNDSAGMNPATTLGDDFACCAEGVERGAALIREAAGNATHLAAGASGGGDADPAKGQGSPTSQGGSQAVVEAARVIVADWREELAEAEAAGLESGFTSKAIDLITALDTYDRERAATEDELTRGEIACAEVLVKPVADPAIETRLVLYEVGRERVAQDAKWGEQNHPDGTGPDLRWQMPTGLSAERLAAYAKKRCQWAAAEGRATYLLILLEEVAEAFAESDPAKLRAELIQVAAVAVQWVETIDRRSAS